MKKSAKKVTMHHFFGNPHYRGKHILLISNKVFTAKTGDDMSKILDEVRKKYPNEIPEIAYIPKKQILTLWM